MSSSMPPHLPDDGSAGTTSADTGATVSTDAPASKASSLFDLRVLIGGLFTLYGVVLIIAGLFASDAELRKADNINMNLWLGIAMLALGLFFLAWYRLRPLQLSATAAGDQPEEGAPRPPGGH